MTVPKKRLSISDRVDLMLKHGVDKPENWMPVRAYVEPNSNDRDRFESLKDHHQKETKFLFDAISELVQRLERVEELLYQANVEISTQDV